MAEPFETPVGIVDELAMEANLTRMAALARAAGLDLRPHAKTHKSPFVAQRQLANGARGLTAATLREAETYAYAGAGDLVIAHPPVGDAKLRRLQALASRGIRLAVALDQPELAGPLPRPGPPGREGRAPERGARRARRLPGLGERVVVVPAHACTTVNLHPELLYAGVTPQLHWEPVSARGWR